MYYRLRLLVGRVNNSISLFYNFVGLKEQECDYLKTKLREAIDEYEKARGGEIAARDEVAQLNSEVNIPCL